VAEPAGSPRIAISSTKDSSGFFQTEISTDRPRARRSPLTRARHGRRASLGTKPAAGTGADLVHFPFSIFHFPFSICHLPFSIFHLPFSVPITSDRALPHPVQFRRLRRGTVQYFGVARKTRTGRQPGVEETVRAACHVWQGGGRLAQCANLLTRPPVLSPDYFLKKLRALAANAPSLRRRANWWTKRNQALFRANMTIPDERTVAATFNRYFNRRRRRRQSYRGLQSQTIGIAAPSLSNESLSALLNQRSEVQLIFGPFCYLVC
jgi:hypothetical protein